MCDISEMQCLGPTFDDFLSQFIKMYEFARVKNGKIWFFLEI